MKNSLVKKIRERSAKIINRYPDLFSELSCLDINKNKILSYGCGLGEELITLSSYFVDSDILGVDISHRALESSRKKIKLKEIKNINLLSTKEFLELEIKFDIIFALNVFKRLKGDYSLEEFCQNIEDLSGYLDVGGILILEGIQYNFEETNFFKQNFEVLPLISKPKGGRHSFKNYAFKKHE